MPLGSYTDIIIIHECVKNFQRLISVNVNVIAMSPAFECVSFQQIAPQKAFSLPKTLTTCDIGLLIFNRTASYILKYSPGICWQSLKWAAGPVRTPACFLMVNNKQYKQRQCKMLLCTKGDIKEFPAT